MVGTINQSTNSPSDAPVVKVKGTNKSIAMTTDCNSRYVHADPFKGAMIAVAEAARNIVCSGGDPAGVTNCLNFGNPYNPEVYYQFVHAIKGMGEACKKFGTPVTGGNVSFYNQSSDENAVFPTPTIGMVGLVEGAHTSLDFKEAGDVIYQVGATKNDISSSQYLVSEHGVQLSPAPYFNLDEEYAMQRAVKNLISHGLVRSAHDASEGGMMIALLEAGFNRNLGFSIAGAPAGMRNDAWLFGETQSRVYVSLASSKTDQLEAMLNKLKVSFTRLGEVTSGRISVGETDFGNISAYRELHETSLEKMMA
jgi:phosphoribosylformylglycinamidine synthase